MEKADFFGADFFATRRPITDGVLIEKYEETKTTLATITKNDADADVELDGLLIKGYETKFANGTNENREQYTREAMTDFVERYYVGRGLNLPVTILHRNDLAHLAGRVVYMEANSVGFYFVAYVPRTYMHYDALRAMLKEGVLQGFSKEGYATEWEDVYNTATGAWEYEVIKKFELLCVSIVATPANGVPFEKLQEAKRDALRFVDKNKKETCAALAGIL